MSSPSKIEREKRIKGVAIYFLLVFGYTIYRNFDFLIWVLSGKSEGTLLQNLIYFPEYIVLVIASVGLFLHKSVGWVASVILTTYGLSSASIYLIQKLTTEGSDESGLIGQIDELLAMPSYLEIGGIVLINGFILSLLWKVETRKTFKIPSWLPLPLALLIPILNFIIYYS